MQSFIKVKETLKAFYGRFDFIIDTIIRFAVALAAMLLMSERLGFFPILTNRFIVPMIALVCSVLPWGMSAGVLAICLLLHVYKASLEIAVILAFLLIVVMLLYYGFQPGDAELMILVPVLFALGIPYAVPFIIGLTGSVISVVPMSVGILIYYLLQFTVANLGMDLDGISLTEVPGKFADVLDGLMTNKAMWLAIAIFAIVLLAVFVLHNLSFDYSRYVALGVGAAVMIVLSVLLKAGFSIVGILLSLLIAAAYNFAVFTVDYKKTERLEFEDDEYVYYVKAVPKQSEQYFTKKGRNGKDN